MSNVRFDELELMLMAMFEQPTLRDTIQVLTEAQPLVAEDAEMAVLVQQTIQKMQQLNEQQFKGLELENLTFPLYRPSFLFYLVCTPCTPMFPMLFCHSGLLPLTTQ